MIFSAQQIFSDDQAITATAISTNVIDTGARDTPYGGAAVLNGDVGKGDSIPLLVQVTEQFNNLTSLTIAVETGATTSLGTVLGKVTVPLASLVAGYQFPLDEISQGLTARYLGLRYTVAGSAPSTGKITAGVCEGGRVLNN